MANESVKNVVGLVKGKNTRLVVLLTFGVIAAALIYANMNKASQSPRPKDLQASVGAPAVPTTNVQPGTSTNPNQIEKVKESDRREVDAAKANGTAAVPRLTAQSGGKEKDPFDLVGKPEVKPEEPAVPAVPAVPPPPVKPVPAPVPVVTPQPVPQVVAAPVKSAELKQAEKELSAVMAAMLNSWNPTGQKIETDHSGSRKNADQAQQAGGNSMATQSAGSALQAFSGSPAVSGGATTDSRKVAIKAGSIMYAVVITSVNSDEPGPVLAEIVAGPYAGGRLLGKFEVSKESEKMILVFNTLTMKNADKSYELNAYAIDPETARTALASDVDHHYLSRYGMFAAGTFLKSYSDAVKNQGTTQTTTIGAAGIQTTTQYPQMSEKDIAISALGAVGGEIATTLKDGLKKPATVVLNSGTQIGLLVMKDISFN